MPRPTPPCGCASRGAAEATGDDVGEDAGLDLHNLVAEGQLLALETGDAQLIRHSGGAQSLDGSVQIGVLTTQTPEPYVKRQFFFRQTRVVVHCGRYP